jgi:hypothetical protein
MPTIQLNTENFRLLFSAFSNSTKYPDAKIQLFWNNSGSYINNQAGGCYCGGLSTAQQTLALNYMTAHLLFIADQAASGETGGVLTGATIDKISVSLEPPPQTNQWQWWLNQSPYGQELLALLQVASVGGRFYNPAMVQGAFRR